MAMDTPSWDATETAVKQVLLAHMTNLAVAVSRPHTVEITTNVKI